MYTQKKNILLIINLVENKIVNSKFSLYFFLNYKDFNFKCQISKKKLIQTIYFFE